MKIAIAVLLTVVGIGQASGASKGVQELASYEFAIDNGGNYLKVTARFSNMGYFSVSSQELAEGAKPVYLTKVLQMETSNTLKKLVIRLANAEISESISDKICKLMAFPPSTINHLSVARDYDSEENIFHGKNEIILGPKGCFIAHKIFPAEMELLQLSMELRSLLKVLALEFIGSRQPLIPNSSLNPPIVL